MGGRGGGKVGVRGGLRGCDACVLRPQTIKPPAPPGPRSPCGAASPFPAPSRQKPHLDPQLLCPGNSPGLPRCCQAEVLRRITRHYKTGKPMPDDLIDKLVKSRLANKGAGGRGEHTASRVQDLGL